jgi:hypothetical protein
MDFKIESPNVALIVNYKGVPIVKTGEGKRLTLNTDDVISHTYYSSLSTALSAYDTNFPLFKYHNPFKAALSESDLTIGTITASTLEASIGDAVTIDCQLSHATFAVSFQWYKDGQEIPGATSNSISTSSLLADQYGQYECRVTITDNTDDRQLILSQQFEVIAPTASLTSATAIGA